MSTAFVFATFVEARPLLETWQAASLRDVPYELFHVPANDALVAICGMGLDAADTALDHLLEAVRPAEVVNCGIAGALHGGLAPAVRERLAATADLVDMEGERIARRCAAQAKPCALLKAVSDHADDRATLLRNLDASSRRLSEFLTRHFRASKPCGAVP